MAEREYEWVKWNEVPGSEEACAKGCMCPVVDNAEMPSNEKWVNADCPLHGCPKPDENGNCPPGTVYINGECALL